MNSNRIFNFSAGPAMLPAEVMEQCSAALVNYQDKGVGIGEVSHVGQVFDSVLTEAIALAKSLVGLSDTHDVVFLQGGATQLFTLIALNFLNGSADYLLSGEWSRRAVVAGREVGRVNIVASTELSNFDHVAPTASWNLSPDADYLHVCSNETIHGHRLAIWPKHKNLIVDASSEFLSRPHPVNDCAMVYGGAQKNLGLAGVVLVYVRKDMYPQQKKVPSKLWSFKDVAEARSLVNTPPTFAVFVLLQTFRWIRAQGGLAEVEKRNAAKAAMLYNVIDQSNGFYKGTVSLKDQRSHMNVTFRLPTEELADELSLGAADNGMYGIRAYRTVNGIPMGGIRASIYNAMPMEGVMALADYMKDFASKKS